MVFQNQANLAHPNSLSEKELETNSRARVDDRRVLNGILWRFRTGSPWADLPERYGPSTTCYNRFVRWQKASVWARLLEAVSEAYDGDIIMIDSTCVRVHQHAATGKKGDEDDGGMGRSRGDLTRRKMWRTLLNMASRHHDKAAAPRFVKPAP